MSTGADWFERRTYRADRLDMRELAERKAAAELTVSVVLPAFNEGQTVAGVVECVQQLRGRLVDEVIVVDGGSTDDTVSRAESAGASVVQDREILPDTGPVLGKGDALWRSLTVATGDIVVFVDTDIRNPHPRFVYGLLGPLLLDPQVQLVKAFYERPLAVGETLHPSGGGRVTELMARPLLNQWWPELAWLVQPLSGEYAGRRELLERIPFFTGYGVELGMLVDTLAAAGPDAIAQVDLAERIHRNQPIESLSRMAYGILQVAATRMHADGRLRPSAAVSSAYVQFRREADGVHPQPREVAVVERAPIGSRR
jgi:glucosyl-3-phosphoglycerate synthase